MKYDLYFVQFDMSINRFIELNKNKTIIIYIFIFNFLFIFQTPNQF